MKSRKVVLINLFARRNRDIDIENELVDATGEGEDGMN